MLVCANGVFFLVAEIVPGTVPVGVAAGVVMLLERRGRSARGHARDGRQPPVLRTRWPEVEPAEA